MKIEIRDILFLLCTVFVSGCHLIPSNTDISPNITQCGSAYCLSLRINCEGRYSVYLRACNELDLKDIVATWNYKHAQGDFDSGKKSFEDMAKQVWHDAIECEIGNFHAEKDGVIHLELKGLAESFFKENKLYIKRRNRDSVLALDVPFIYISPTVLPEETTKGKQQ